MNSSRLVGRLFSVTLLAGISGCATAYHQYPSGCVSYGYCPPAPLPYATYSGCPTPVATTFEPTSAPLPFSHDHAAEESAAGDPSVP